MLQSKPTDDKIVDERSIYLLINSHSFTSVFLEPYRVEEKYASATVHYKTITFWETSSMNSNIGSYQK